MERLQTLGLVAAGGALGAMTRYLGTALCDRAFGTRFPWATLLVNLSGCLALGFVLTLLDERMPRSDVWKPLLAVGFLGAYTTFSTFSWELHALFRDGEWERASAYVLGSVALGLVLLRLGVVAARSWS